MPDEAPCGIKGDDGHFGCALMVAAFLGGPYVVAVGLGESHEAAITWSGIGGLLGVFFGIFRSVVFEEFEGLEEREELGPADTNRKGGPSWWFQGKAVAIGLVSYAVLIGVWFIPGVKETVGIIYGGFLTVVSLVMAVTILLKLLS